MARANAIKPQKTIRKSSPNKPEPDVKINVRKIASKLTDDLDNTHGGPRSQLNAAPTRLERTRQSRKVDMSFSNAAGENMHGHDESVKHSHTKSINVTELGGVSKKHAMNQPNIFFISSEFVEKVFDNITTQQKNLLKRFDQHIDNITEKVRIVLTVKDE